MDLPQTSYAILGLLSVGPQSGYELSRFADRSIARFWPISRSLVYRELARLERLDLVSAVEIAQQRRPDKRLYALTAEGRAALDRWLIEGEVEPDRYRSEFLLRFFFADRIAGSRLRQLLDECRSRAERDLADLREKAERLEGSPTARFRRLAALHGVQRAEARLAWLNEVEAELAGELAGASASRRD